MVRRSTRPRSLLRTLGIAALVAFVVVVAGIVTLVVVGLRQPEPPIDALSSRAELAARLPAAPRGARLLGTTFRPSRGCGSHCAVYAQTYALPDRTITVEDSCAAYFDALDQLETAGYDVVEARGAEDRDGCERMIVPAIASLMERDDGERRERFVFEAYPTKTIDALVFAAVEPQRPAANRRR